MRFILKCLRYNSTELLINNRDMEEDKRIISISKDQLASLPIATYDRTIVLVDTIDDALKAVEELTKEKVIGFDTETKPSFKRGQTNKVSLLQLSSHSTCYLFRLNHIGLHPAVKSLLENKEILKVGLSIHDDFHNLNKICALNPDGFIDLQAYVKQFRIADNSLARIYAVIFGKRISKGQRLTNWEADELTPNQQAYASLDAFACVSIYDYLSQGHFKPLESKYLTLPSEPIAPAPKDDAKEP